MQFFNHPLAACAYAAIAFAVIMWGIPALVDFVAQKFSPTQPFAPTAVMPTMGAKQRGIVLLGRSYKGYVAGAITQLATQEESALIAQGLATANAGPVTSGAVTTTASSGRVAFAAAAASLVINHPQIDANSKVFAVINQAAADGTLTSIQRIVPGAGLVTLYGNAAATAVVSVDWFLMPSSQGMLPPQP